MLKSELANSQLSDPINGISKPKEWN
jgi:hypothetical protein